MKYLYILVSQEADYYLEQLFLSVTTLRCHMPDAFVALLVDDKTAATLATGIRKQIHELVNEYKVIPLSKDFSAKQRSRWLKTVMREHISDDFLYIDCDTIITGDLSSIANKNISIGAVLDKHCLIDTHSHKVGIQRNDIKIGFTSSLQSNFHFNGGVIYCKDTQLVHDFFSQWHKLYLASVSKDVFIDQPSFNQANFDCHNIIVELDGIWNCQVSLFGLLHINNAKIIHYFAVAGQYNMPYYFSNLCVYQRIRKEKNIPADILEKAHHPATLFHPQTHLTIEDSRPLEDIVFDNIKYRSGIGIKFILRCFWERLLQGLGIHK
jgi:hypothetical protein